MGTKTVLLIIVFSFIAQFSYGQEKYTIRGEFPDHSLDNEYVYLNELTTSLGESARSKYTLIAKVLVVDKMFHYKGTINRKPFLAAISYGEGKTWNSEYFVVEPGNIQICIADWKNAMTVSGTPINDDYNKYIIEPYNELKPLREEQKEIREAFARAEESKFIFMEKYAQYPDVIRSWLCMYLNMATDNPYSKENTLPQCMKIVNLMPKADRDKFLAWIEYRIKLKEYRDSVKANEPRFIDTIPNTTPSTTRNE